jgi:hypothetical protein
MTTVELVERLANLAKNRIHIKVEFSEEIVFIRAAKGDLKLSHSLSALEVTNANFDAVKEAISKVERLIAESKRKAE